MNHQRWIYEEVPKMEAVKVLLEIDVEQQRADFARWCELQKQKEEIEQNSGVTVISTITDKNKNYPLMRRFDL